MQPASQLSEMALVRTWSLYVEKATQIRNETGVLGLCSRLLHKVASPALDWGAVTLFVQKLDSTSIRQVEVPNGVQLKHVPAAEICELKEGGDPTQDLLELTSRYRRGDEAFTAIAESGEAAHLRWVSKSRAHIPELGRDLVLSPGQAYFYNGYTRPDMRNRGYDGLVRNFIFRTLQAAGCTEVFSYVRRDNRMGLRAASRWQKPVATFWYFRVGRFSPIVLGRSRSRIPRLVKARADARERILRDTWGRWFESWLNEPLSKRSMGCAALPEPYFRSAAAFIDSTLQLDPSSDVVLDVGCDSAMISRLITPRCRRFVGVDFIPGMLRDAHTNDVMIADGGRAWFVAGDGCHLPLRSRAFARVYCSAVIHTLPSREHGLAIIDELVRVTAPGGRVLVSSVPDRAKRFVRLAAIWRGADWRGRLTLPIRWMIPMSVKQIARHILRRPSTELPAFLDYDLEKLRRSLEARGLSCEIRGFPSDYWSRDFKTSRSDLLIGIPR